MKVMSSKDGKTIQLAQGSFNVSDYCNSTQQDLKLTLTGTLVNAKVICEVSVVSADQQSIIGVDYDDAVSGVTI
jgi:hypothetical protein